MVFATFLCSVLLSVNIAAPLDTGMLHLDEVTITASHRHANPISSQSSVEVDAAYLNEQIPVSRGGAGVISIILKDGTEIPRQTDQTNLKKFTPLGWQLPQDFYMQPYTDPAKRPATLLWIPDVQSQVMSFSTDGHATVYDVVIEGVTSRGRLIREHKEIFAY